MTVPDGILCSKTHQWAYLENDECVSIGLTDYIMEESGDIVFIELPEVSAVFYKDEVFSTIETIRSANELYMPISGEVIEVNEKLINSPELISEDPFENWLIKVKPFDFKQDSLGLLDYDEYKDELD